MKFIYGLILGSLFVLHGCAQDTCSTNADCAQTEACVNTGGVLFSGRECIPTLGPTSPTDMTTSTDLTATDMAATDMPAADMAGDSLESTDAGNNSDVPCAESNEEICQRAGAVCGVLITQDICGVERTLSCGSCEPPELCSESNTCACDAETNEAFCARLGRDCGDVRAPDNCGSERNANCGMCEENSLCGLYSINVCGCPCNIEGQCYPDGAQNPANSCQSCDASKSSDSWSTRTGSCDDGDACTTGDTCVAGVCKGTAKNCSLLDSPCGKGICANGSCALIPVREGESCGLRQPGECSGERCRLGSCVDGVDPGMCLINDRCYRNGESAGSCCSYCDASNPRRATLRTMGTSCGGGCSCSSTGTCTSGGRLCLETCAQLEPL